MVCLARFAPLSREAPPLRALLVMMVMVCALHPAVARADTPTHWLGQQIARLAADPRIAPARVGVLVQDVPTGKTLVQHNASETFNVASCTKLVTTATAMWALGPEYRFKTAIYGDRTRAARGAGEPRSGAERSAQHVTARGPRAAKNGNHGDGAVLPGNLYLKGFGSPVLGEQDLWQLVDDLKDRGIREVRGAVVIDESYFDGQRLAPLYDTHSTDAWYRPPSGPISIGFNVVSVQVMGGGAPGQPARVVLRPHSSYFKLDSDVSTVSARRRSWVQVHTTQRGDQTEVVVKGRVRPGYRRRPFRHRIEDPGLLAGQTLLDILARQGIRVGERRVRRGKVPPGARALAWHHSEPLAVVLRLMNKHSNNFIAEQVLRVVGAEVMGQPGTWAKGLAAVGRYLKTLAIKPGEYTMKNGSGLYDASAFTPAQLVTVLRRSWLRFRVGPDFVSTLAQAGVDGTLHQRYIGSGAERYVRAKTGTLARVVTLAGFAGAATDRGPLTFAILLNDLPEGKVRQARAVVDEMAEAMVTFLER